MRKGGLCQDKINKAALIHTHTPSSMRLGGVTYDPSSKYPLFAVSEVPLVTPTLPPPPPCFALFDNRSTLYT